MPNKMYTPLAFTPWVAEALSRSEYAIIITGAGGWLGQATLEMLESCLGNKFERRVHLFGASARSLPMRSGKILACNALQDITSLKPQPCLVFHYAFLTRDRADVMPLADFISQNEAISTTVYEAAKRLGASGIFLPSSGALYRADRSIDDDIKNNPYGVMKARDEQRFQALQSAMRVAICRVFNLAGPFINKLRSYALSSILMDILQDKPIGLLADRPVIRSYIHVRDVIDVGLASLLPSAPVPGVFDTAGEEEIEIGDLALRIATLLGKPDWPIERPAITGSPNRYVGDGKSIEALMKLHSIVRQPLDAQILATMEYCKNMY